MPELASHLVKIRAESHRGLGPQEIVGLATRFFGKLSEIILAPIDSPISMREVPYAGRIEGEDDDACALSILNRRVHIGVWISAPIKGIDADSGEVVILARRKLSRPDTSHARPLCAPSSVPGESRRVNGPRRCASPE